MYAAPPVSVRGTGGPAWRAVQALLHGLAAGALAVWALGHTGLAAVPALLSATVAALLAAAIGWRLARSDPATLSWDGQRWTLDGQAGSLNVMIDLDRWCLLRCRLDGTGGGTRWLALAATEAGVHWPLLRAALHARVPLPAAAAGPAERGADV